MNLRGDLPKLECLGLVLPQEKRLVTIIMKSGTFLFLPHVTFIHGDYEHHV